MSDIRDNEAKSGEIVMIHMTKSQCASVAEFIELNLYNWIRSDDEIDNMDWLADMAGAYRAFKAARESKGIGACLD